MRLPKMYYCLIVCVLIFLGVIVYSAFTPEDESWKKVPDMFGLSSTECTISIDDEDGTELPVWSLPSGKSYSDIEWSSDNESVASVSGGTVKGLSEGTALITAKLGDYSDTCKVTVITGEVKTQSRNYDAYSKDFDYLLLSDSTTGGFAQGLLSATFNAGDCVVFSLAGYKEKWLTDNTTFVGNASADFAKIVMKLIDSDGNVVASEEYTNEYKSYTVPFDGSTHTITLNKSDTALFSVNKSSLSYGETYTVSFILYANNGLFSYTSVVDTFEYCKGDGYHDVSGTFTRAYAWRFGGTSTTYTENEYLHSFTITYDYADYWNSYYKSSKLLTITDSSVRDYRTYEWVYEFASDSTMVAELSEMLKESYRESDYTGQDFAQYILAFGQINYDYCYDNVQYYINDDQYSDKVDFWAYSGQTIFSGYGDCEDTSILIAAIYKKLGYESAVMVLPNHMALSVHLKDYTNAIGGEYMAVTKEGKSYYFCESTVKSPVLAFSLYSYRWVSYYEGLSSMSTYYLIGMSGSDYQDSDLKGFYIL